MTRVIFSNSIEFGLRYLLHEVTKMFLSDSTVNRLVPEVAGYARTNYILRHTKIRHWYESIYSPNLIMMFYNFVKYYLFTSSFRKFILISYLYSAFACIVHFLYQSLFIQKDLDLIV